MRRFGITALAALSVFAGYARAQAPTISWTGGYPKTGNMKFTIALQGTVTPPKGWSLTTITVDCWPAGKNGGQLSSNDMFFNAQGQFGPVNVAVSQSGVLYSVLLKAKITSGKQVKTFAIGVVTATSG